jgi:hypothetical protein
LGTGGHCDYTSGQCLCEYNSTEMDNKTVLNTCGIVPEVAETESSTVRPMLRPTEPEKLDPAVPPPGTPLSDYYVSDVDKLEDQHLVMDAGVIALVSLGVFILLSLALTLLLTRSKKEGTASSALFGCVKKRTAREGDESHPVASRHREKDKMIASVLVDMRIHGIQRNLSESLADTDDRLTESEVGSGPLSESMSDRSSDRCEEAISDVDTSQDGVDDDVDQPQVIRRRRIVSDFHVFPS